MTEWTYDDFIAAMATLCAVRGKHPGAGNNVNDEVRALIPDIDTWVPYGGPAVPVIDVLRRAAYFEIAGNKLWSAYPDRARARALLKRGPGHEH